MAGTLEVKGKIAYVSSDPFISTGSILDNILFGERYDHDRLEKVLELCQLKKDLELYPDNIATVIGEKGLNISIGQRTKISLARAIYSQASIYLFDDPLGNLDRKVGDKIFNSCIKDYLKDKLRILVSHHIYYMKKSEKILYL